MKNLTCLFIALLAFLTVNAQNAEPAVSPEDGVKKCHKFFFVEPATELIELKYKDGTTLEGKLSSDGREVLMCDYTKKGSVTAVVKREDGTEEEINKTPCDIAEAKPIL